MYEVGKSRAKNESNEHILLQVSCLVRSQNQTVGVVRVNSQTLIDSGLRNVETDSEVGGS